MELVDTNILGYGLDDRGSIPGRRWKSFSSLPCPDRISDPPSLPSKGYRSQECVELYLHYPL